MTCPIINPDGLRGTGPNAYGTEYPFTTAVPELPHVFADAYLAYSPTDLVSDIFPPLRFVWLYGFDSVANCGSPAPPDLGSGPAYVHTHTCDVILEDSHNNTIFDSTTALTYRGGAFGTRLYVHEWETASAIFRLVQHIAVPTLVEYQLVPHKIWPASAVLDAQCLEQTPARVLKLGVEHQSVLLTPLPPDVLLAAGYNLDLVTAPVRRGARTVSQITLSARSGAGAGNVPTDCGAAAPPITTINGEPGDAHGNFSLGADGCFAVRQPATYGLHAYAPIPATLKLTNDCVPCCSCDDYMRGQDAILTVWQHYRVMAATAADAATSYRGQTVRWATAKACREAKIVTVAGAPTASWIDVLVGVVNTTSDCYTTVTAALTAAVDGGTFGAPVPGTSFLTDGRGGVLPVVPTVTGTTYAVVWAVVPPRSRVVWQLRLAIPPPSLVVPVNVTLTAAVTAIVPPAVSAAALGSDSQIDVVTFNWDR